MGHGDALRLARGVVEGLEVALIAAGGADVAQPGRPAGDAGQLDGVQHQRAELDFGAAAGAQATGGGEDGGGVGRHGRKAYGARAMVRAAAGPR